MSTAYGVAISVSPKATETNKTRSKSSVVKWLRFLLSMYVWCIAGGMTICYSTGNIREWRIQDNFVRTQWIVGSCSVVHKQSSCNDVSSSVSFIHLSRYWRQFTFFSFCYSVRIKMCINKSAKNGFCFWE